MLSPGSPPFEALVNWLASRQTGELGEEEEEEEEEEGNKGQDQPKDETESHQPISEEDISTLPLITSLADDSIPCAGFNGRCNKVADTCYSFWNGATLMMLDRSSVVDSDRNRRYLLGKTQHLVGGFGKVPGDPPDLLHSCFGLISLAFQGEAGLAHVDPALVTTDRVVQHLESLPWRT